MTQSKLFQHKHQLWLGFLFGSFSVENEAVASVLYDFAMIEFRHLGWLGARFVEEAVAFDYEKETIDFMATDTHMLFQKLIRHVEKIKEIYPTSDDAMWARFESDERYFCEKLRFMEKEQPTQKITAFDKQRVLTGYDLSQAQMDALTLFLFEESYKEYELILVYLYANFFTDSKTLSNIFITLIDESQFHLRSFARMMAKLGILSVPRTIIGRIYRFDDLKKFLTDGIKEEEGAKEECLKLARAIAHEDLSHFFNFINFQENYHIALMQKALAHIEGVENGSIY